MTPGLSGASGRVRCGVIVIWLACCCLMARGMLDVRHFAHSDPDTLPVFQEPDTPPPSFLFARSQLRPPYDLNTYSPEPFAGCDAEFASPCGIQQAIRVVTLAREGLCPELDLGGDEARAALTNVSAGTYVPIGTRNFGLLVLLANGTIVADGLRPELVGQRIDGQLAAGWVAQPTLLAHVDWVVRWGGGWVPHYTTRLEPQKTWYRSLASVPALAYFEACPGGHRLGVAVGKKPIPAKENCRPVSNNICAIQNMNRILGRNLVDFLGSSNFRSIEDQAWRISHTEDYSVGEFWSFMYQLSPWGAPGPHPFYNPLPELLSTDSTYWASGAGYLGYMNGRNMSDFFLEQFRGDQTQRAYGDWLQSQISHQAYLGGGWFTYRAWDFAIGPHSRLSLAFAVIWNNTGWLLGTGTAHIPEQAPAAPRCGECSPAVSLPCSAVTCRRLAAHAQAEFLHPAGNWSTISRSRWFGSLQPAADDAYPATWPSGFHVYAFDWAGTCVADGGRPADIGLSAGELIGWPAHERCKLTAGSGGGWVSYTKPDGSERLAFIIQAARAGQRFYLAVAFRPRWAAWDAACSSRYAEPCSEQNAHVLAGAANADILSASSTASLLTVLEHIGRRTAAYSPEQLGDFRAHVYSSSWECVPEVAAAGLPCPPKIHSDALALLQAASLDEAGRWTEASALLESASGQQRAFVLGTVFAELGSAERRQLFILVVVSADHAPPRCNGSTTSDGSAACPPDADCEDGFCKCRLGFHTDFVPNSSACEQLKPAEMSCRSVSGLDCAAAAAGSACPPCGAGHFCPQGAPLACPPGSFCPDGISQPVPCDPGTYSVAARATSQAACLACQPGTFTSKGGQTACTACASGRFTNSTRQSACELCAESTFQPEEGSRACHSCEDVVHGATTALLGATSPEECLCPEDTYLPLDVAQCWVCPLGLHCCQGSSLQNLQLPPGRMHRGCRLQPSPELLPGYWSDPSEPLLVFECNSDKRCPGGRPGTCGSHLIGRACAHCEEGFFLTDTGCAECALTDKAAWVFPLIPLLLVFIVPGVLYWRMRDPYLKWGSWPNVCTCLMFIGLNHYQMIDIVASTTVHVPSELADTYKSWAITNNFLALFKTSCTGVTDTRQIMAIKASAPLLLGLSICIQMLASRLVSWARSNRELRLNANRLFNVYFAILFTFFGAMSAMSLELFKCTRNPEPNAAVSLLSDLSIICYSSEEWMSMLALAVVSVLLYVVCVGLTLVCTVLMAKSLFHDPAFRQRWAFLFLKYRLGCWWWGLVFLVKNFAVNISLVIFSSPVWQLHFIQLSILGYMIWVQKAHPYRSLTANRVEVLSCLSIVLNSSIMAGFAFAVEKAAQEGALGIVASLITYLPLFFGGCAILYIGFYGLQARAGLRMGLAHEAQREVALMQDAHRISDSFGQLVALTEGGCREVLRHLGEYERRVFREVDGMLCSELAWGGKEESRRRSQLSAGELQAHLEEQGIWALAGRDSQQSKVQIDDPGQMAAAEVGTGGMDSQSRWAEKVEGAAAAPKVKLGIHGEVLLLDSL